MNTTCLHKNCATCPRVVTREIRTEAPVRTEYPVVFSWTLDMFRAMTKFGPIRKWLLRAVMGRYAYREMVGARDALLKYGFGIDIDLGYDDLKSMSYHKEKVSL